MRLDKLNLYAYIFQVSSAAMLITDADFKILEINPAFSEITGFSKHDLEKMHVFRIFDLFANLNAETDIIASIKDKNFWRGEVAISRKYKESFVPLVLIDPIKNTAGCVSNYSMLFLDISDHQKLENELRYHAEIDPLTGLANRNLFFQNLDNALALAKRFNDNVALLYLDLDGFKQVNDIFGHGHGDEVLIEVARCLKSCIREVDTVARLGGDEFVIILNRTSKLMVNDTAQRIIDALNIIVEGDECKLKVTASIGIAIFPDDSINPMTLLKYADAAMYAAKHKGKSQYCWHFS